MVWQGSSVGLTLAESIITLFWGGEKCQNWCYPGATPKSTPHSGITPGGVQKPYGMLGIEPILAMCNTTALPAILFLQHFITLSCWVFQVFNKNIQNNSHNYLGSQKSACSCYLAHGVHVLHLNSSFGNIYGLLRKHSKLHGVL